MTVPDRVTRGFVTDDVAVTAILGDEDAVLHPLTLALPVALDVAQAVTDTVAAPTDDVGDVVSLIVDFAVADPLALGVTDLERSDVAEIDGLRDAVTLNVMLDVADGERETRGVTEVEGVSVAESDSRCVGDADVDDDSDADIDGIDTVGCEL